MNEKKADLRTLLARTREEIQRLTNKITELTDQLIQARQQISQLQDELAKAQNPISPWRPDPYIPWPKIENRCPVCGIDFDHGMLYCCTRNDCPSRVTVLSGGDAPNFSALDTTKIK